MKTKMHVACGLLMLSHGLVGCRDMSGFAPHAAGTVDVVVTNPGGLESRLTGGFTVPA